MSTKPREQPDWSTCKVHVVVNIWLIYSPYSAGDPQQESGTGTRVAQEHGGQRKDFYQDDRDENDGKATDGPEKEGRNDDGGDSQNEQRFVCVAIQFS